MANTPLSSPIVRDGDTTFIGIQSRRNPLTLPSGYLQSATNVRLDRGIAQPRKGAARLASGLSSAGLPLTIPFTPISITLSSLTQTGNVAMATTASPHGLLSGYLVRISGASPSAYNVDAVITLDATNPTTKFTYAISGNPTSPATGTISAAYPIVQSTYASGIFGAGIYSSPRLDNANEYIVLAGATQAYLWRYNVGSTPSVVTKSYPTSPIVEQILTGDVVNIVQAYDQCFLFRWRASDTQQKVTSITQTSGTATITTPSAHGYATGEVVRLSGSDQAGFNLDAVITYATATTFTVAVPIGTSANTSTALFAQRVCCPLFWDGGSGGFVRVTTGTSSLGPTYSNLIAPYNGIATFYNNQLVIASQRDGLLVSDILSPQNFDPLLKSFRTNVGSNDSLVAVHPYANGEVIVFLRKSIYLGKLAVASDGVSIDPAASFLQILTNEIGCSARQTVATAGQYVYFLSDAGVYRLDNSQIDLALRGNTLPLSEPISDQLANINMAASSTSQGIYFNNRYWLAVPTNGATRPNTIFVYSQLNEAWESVDSYQFGSIDSLVISDYGTERRLFAASSTGLLYLLDSIDGAYDDSATGAGTAGFSGSITTRRYFYGTLGRKRLGNTACSVLLPIGAGVSVNATTHDPDTSLLTVASVTNATGADNDYTIRAPIRRAGTYLDLTVTSTSGRPTIRAINADATLPSDTSRLARTES